MMKDDMNNSEIQNIPLEQIRMNPYQPRKEFDEDKIIELAESIRIHGLFTPVLLSRSTVKGYDLVAGERRYRAHQLLGLSSIPAIIRELTPTEMMEIALLENIQREDLSPIEEAQAYKQLLEFCKYTQETLAKRMGKSKAAINNSLRLLRLPKPVQKAVIAKQYSMSHARTLLGLNDESLILPTFRKSMRKGTSVHELEDIVRKLNQNLDKAVKTERPYAVIEKRLSQKYKATVIIDKDTVTIKYKDTQQLNDILDRMDALEEEL